MKSVIIVVCLLISGNVFAKMNRKSVSPKVKKELLAVFEKNEKLHNAFFSYETEKEDIPGMAEQLSKAIDGISDKKIRQLLRYSQSKLAEIKIEVPKEKNGQNYHLFSMAMIHILKAYDIGSSYNAYSCPMVKMKWVQNSKKVAKVHNPYAPQMPHCGQQDTYFQ